MVEKQILTPSELEAKKYLMNIIKNGSLRPCDIGDGANISATLPCWYNKESFKRGQKYFVENRVGILVSNMCGLLTLLADPKGLDVLDSTGRSSTAETAKKRYVSTIVHMISWYEEDLHPDSKSWASLSRVRKMHLNASNNAVIKELGTITQSELALTTFGFMGFALVRPQFLGIRCDKKKNREGFVHFWAVMGHMLGVKDEFNMCLFDIETVENICMMLLRYVFIPIIQLETPKFQQMTKALLEGLSAFMPHMSYDIQMFLVKRIIGVPGYQYGVDLSKEKICKQIFSEEELCAAKEVVRTMYHSKNDLLKPYEILFHDGIPLIASNNCVPRYKAVNNDDVENDPEHNQFIEVGDKKFTWIMRSQHTVDWQVYLNDTELYKLSKWDQFTIRRLCLVLKWCDNSVGKYFVDMGLSVVLFFIRRYYNSKIARKTSR